MLAEYNIKSKEARKYIFNCLDDMSRVNMPKYEASELVVEKVKITSQNSGRLTSSIYFKTKLVFGQTRTLFR